MYLLCISYTFLKVHLVYQSPISQITCLHWSAPDLGKFSLGYIMIEASCHPPLRILSLLFKLLFSLSASCFMNELKLKPLAGLNQKWGRRFFQLSYYYWQLYRKRDCHIMQIHRYRCKALHLLILSLLLKGNWKCIYGIKITYHLLFHSKMDKTNWSLKEYLKKSCFCCVQSDGFKCHLVVIHSSSTSNRSKV